MQPCLPRGLPGMPLIMVCRLRFSSADGCQSKPSMSSTEYHSMALHFLAILDGHVQTHIAEISYSLAQHIVHQRGDS